VPRIATSRSCGARIKSPPSARACSGSATSWRSITSRPAIASASSTACSGATPRSCRRQSPSATRFTLSDGCARRGGFGCARRASGPSPCCLRASSHSIARSAARRRSPRSIAACGVDPIPRSSSAGWSASCSPRGQPKRPSPSSRRRARGSRTSPRRSFCAARSSACAATPILRWKRSAPPTTRRAWLPFGTCVAPATQPLRLGGALRRLWRVG